MPKPPATKRTMISLEIPPDVLTLVDQAAASKHRSRGSFVRTAIYDKLRELGLLDEVPKYTARRRE